MDAAASTYLCQWNWSIGLEPKAVDACAFVFVGEKERACVSERVRERESERERSGEMRTEKEESKRTSSLIEHD